MCIGRVRQCGLRVCVLFVLACTVCAAEFVTAAATAAAAPAAAAAALLESAMLVPPCVSLSSLKALVIRHILACGWTPLSIFRT